jgi:hypothetical protein
MKADLCSTHGATGARGAVHKKFRLLDAAIEFATFYVSHPVIPLLGIWYPLVDGAPPVPATAAAVHQLHLLTAPPRAPVIAHRLRPLPRHRHCQIPHPPQPRPLARPLDLPHHHRRYLGAKRPANDRGRQHRPAEPPRHPPHRTPLAISPPPLRSHASRPRQHLTHLSCQPTAAPAPPSRLPLPQCATRRYESTTPTSCPS